MTAGMTQGYSQKDITKGVLFENNSSWQRILEKAKMENKYVFVDCYATWCRPCKDMEQRVYPDKAVGEALNKDFIAVKLQMDRTPTDNDQVKSWYRTAQTFESAYTINAYPTFLFFDPEGKPVHKAIGYKNAAGFMKLAADARNPKKQYFAILRNFRPRKLDTAAEKGLAISYQSIDQSLGAKIATDYLHRIPKGQWGFEDNLSLMTRFGNNPEIRQMAKDYIFRLHEKEFNSKPMLEFLARFTVMPQDRGFTFFYGHIAEADTIMGDPDWAQAKVAQVISHAGFEPLLEAAKKTGATPNFDSIGSAIAKQYNAYYSVRVIQDGKVHWYGWLVHKKNQPEFWPPLAQVDIERLKRIWDDDRLRNASTTFEVNNVCYTDIFHHSDDSAQLNLAVRWMKEVVQLEPNDFDELDTYACLLYKAGNVDAALQAEDEILQFCIKHRKMGTHTRMSHATLAIQRMWNSEKIWEEKEFQD
jgi:thioredoxin-related protein